MRVPRAGSASDWNARAYDRLDRPQRAWARATLDALELRGDERVLDAGCGTGTLADAVASRLPGGRVLALDHSAAMLEVARETLESTGPAPVAIVRADLTALPFCESLDWIVSNAVFHWVLDHERLFRQLFRALRPGGRLVAQCGGGPNIARLLDRARRLLATEPYRPYLDDWTEPWLFADAESTASRLAHAGFIEVETEVVEAPTVLPDRAHYVAFLETVVLRTHCARLPSVATREAFLTRLGEAAAADDPPFGLDYWRLNMRARRPLSDGS